MANNKPPDTHKTIKCQLIHILNNSNVYNKKDILQTINDAVNRTNKIVNKSYMLLRLYILLEYEANRDIPYISKDVINMSLKAVCNVQKRSGKLTNSNLDLKNKLTDIYTSHISTQLENSKNLKPILDYSATTIITSIENNIKNNFISYINRFVNSYIKHKYENELQNKDTKNIIYNDIKVLKRDIIENTSKCNPKYHEWLEMTRNKIVPLTISNTNNIYMILKDDPQSFIKYMIYMNIEIEKIGKKQFQFFPLQTNIILNYIKLDTVALINLFENNVSKKCSNIETIKKQLWSDIFNLTSKKFKGYSFDYMLSTDGFAVSLLFINNNSLEKQIQTKEKQRVGRKTAAEEKKLLNDDEKLSLREANKLKRNNSNIAPKPIINLTNKPNQNHNKTEFPYIDDVDKTELGDKHLYIDPGKRSLFTIVSDDGIFLKYTNAEHITNTKRLKYQKQIKKYKQRKGVKSIESELSGYNSKTCKVNDFKRYLKKKLEINNKLIDSYNDLKYRKYKWYSYINTKRAEDNMLNKIENKYGKNYTIIIGDWSITKQMANFISTPNIKLKRKLRERFKVFNIDEFRTSCLHNKTEELCKHLYLPCKIRKSKDTNSTSNEELVKDKKYQIKSMHSILTFQMENNRLGCIDRDNNGCLNIKKLFKSYIKNGEIPLRYRRGYNLTTPSTVSVDAPSILTVK